MSNTMSVEQKIVQKLKDETIYQLIGDEDAIEALVGRAIKEALLQERRVLDGYSARTVDSPIVAAARDVATQAMKILIQREVDAVVADPVAIGMLHKAFVDQIPIIMSEIVRGTYHTVASQVATNSIATFQEYLRIGVVR